MDKSLENYPENLDEKVVRKLEAQSENVKTYFNEAASPATNTPRKEEQQETRTTRRRREKDGKTCKRVQIF